MTQATPEIHLIKSCRSDTYHDKVVQAYDDPPEAWQEALGENLSFQFGVFDQAEMAGGPLPGPVGPSGIRHFDLQLKMTGLLGPGRRRINRILDLGCGWGDITRYMADLFPECPRIDCVNISQRQLEHCAARLSDDQRSRINLYLCNGQDVDLLPDPAVPYDLVIVRGVYTHFMPQVFEESVAQVFKRLAYNGKLIISDTLYRCDLATYKSPIPDTVDRLACGHRKSPEYFSNVLEKSGLQILDMRIMPSNAEVIHWLQMVRLNIEQNFPNGAPGAIQELHEMAISLSQTLATEKASVYSILLMRPPREL